MATNLKENQIQTEQSYTMANIRKKIFNGSPILSTTIDTHIEFFDIVDQDILCFK